MLIFFCHIVVSWTVDALPPSYPPVMSLMAVVFALILIFVLLGCWILTMLGLPGNWLMAAATATYAHLTPANSPTAIGWRTVVAVVVLAVLGESIEFTAGALGVARTGGSRRSALMALVGSVAGSLLGVAIGVPIPVVGSVVAAVFFAGIGAMAGAVLGELSVGRTPGRRLARRKSGVLGTAGGHAGQDDGRRGDDRGRCGGDAALVRNKSTAYGPGRGRHHLLLQR